MSLGERLRAARAGAGLSLRELAEMTPVSHTAVAKYEKDEDVPSSPVLIALADATGVDMGFLFRSSDVQLGAPSWRKRKVLTKTEEVSILAKTRDVLERYFEAEDLLGLEPLALHIDLTPSAVQSLDDAERVAEELRGAWQLGLGPVEDLAELLENRGIRVVYLPASEAFDGLTVRANDAVPVIVLNSDFFPGDRRRLSLAHELAHIVMDIREGVDAEQAANRFAGAFLFPAQMVVRELGVRRNDLSIYELHLLKHKWGLSMQGIIHRAEQAGVISSSRANGMRMGFRKNHWTKTEPGDQYVDQRSRRLERLVMKALAEGAISRTKASELLGMSFDDFRQNVVSEHGADLVGTCN